MDRDMLRRTILRETSVVAATFLFAGSVWLRISAQIYNEIGDYRALMRVLPKVLREFGLP
jgi:hypothetical protein